MTDDSHCGPIIDRALRRCGLSMIEVARRTGISPSVLSRIRTGARAPTEAHLTAIGTVLGLDSGERETLALAAARMRLPPAQRERLARESMAAHHALDRRHVHERAEGAWRAGNDFNDGWWLSYSRSFRNDGLIQRSLIRVEGDRASIQVMDGGDLRFSYHGSFEILGDKIFIRAAEDRGDAEHLQIVLHSLFDIPEPILLHGLVCGISGRDLHHPVAVPAASRIVLLYAGDLEMPGQRLRSLQAQLGGWTAEAVVPCWPPGLGSDRALRSALRLGDGDLDRALLALIDNHLGPADHVLRGGWG